MPMHWHLDMFGNDLGVRSAGRSPKLDMGSGPSENRANEASDLTTAVANALGLREEDDLQLGV